MRDERGFGSWLKISIKERIEGRSSGPGSTKRLSPEYNGDKPKLKLPLLQLNSSPYPYQRNGRWEMRMREYNK